ncbi:hypothetical protein, variant 1 [Aphanomyces astaci]|uniref:CRAL-TRIO domain-containing protein n=1 Tax=Aphanomyces astaci TaxID=112090 RepID=W4FKX1_APHAT|nr:hypothetical protein, variant 1 [Aphanomyces astaci]ETV68110.1 hypothetical protein, variant 1 [Aphanomyces astaci]|eukprot:XP_009842413.1 hypothetical protein, variant 1 [Aphanomyces astaci]
MPQCLPYAIDSGLGKGDSVPYPVTDEVEHIEANKQVAQAAAEEERQRRMDEVRCLESESAIVREINIEYAIAAMETERTRRVSQHNLASVHNELLREKSKKEVHQLVEEERGRRMSQGNLAAVHDEIHREQAKQVAVMQMEQERSRRMSEGMIAQVHTELLRVQSKRAVVEAMEAERTHRMSQDAIAEVHTHLLRRNSIDKVVELAEHERSRRVQELGDQVVANQSLRLAGQAAAVEAAESERRRRLSSIEHVTTMAGISAVEGSVAPVDMKKEEEVASMDMSAPVVAMSYPDLPVASATPDVEQKALHDLTVALADVVPLPTNSNHNDDDVSKLQRIRLLRFLRGHKGNVEVAAAKYRANLVVRQEHNLDTIRDNILLGHIMTELDFPHNDKIRRYVPVVAAYDVQDDQHNVFVFEKLGAVDVHGLVVNVSDAEWLAFTLHELEFRSLALDRRSLEQGRLVRFTVLRDLDGFSLARLTRPALARLQRTVALASTCYPEYIHKSVFINTPWMFHTAWKGIQLWLDDAQRQKMIFLKRGDASGTLDKICPPASRPLLFGGTNHRIDLPATGLLGKDSYAMLRENGATEAEIRARGTLTVPFRVNANDTLCWEFCVQQYDVDFLVKFRTQGDGGAVELNVDGWDKARFVHGQVEAASWTAPSAGVAVLCWDNSFSWTRGKTLCYKASVAKLTVLTNDVADDAAALDLSGHTSL